MFNSLTLFLLLFLNSEETLVLETAIQTPLDPGSSFSLDPSSGFLGAGKNELYHWVGTRLHRVVTLPKDKTILAHTYQDGLYWISYFEKENFSVGCFDQFGQLMRTQSVDGVVTQIHFGEVNFLNKMDFRWLYDDPYVPMIWTIQASLDHKSELFQYTGERFFKLSERVYEYQLNFRKVWVLKEGESYLTVSQLDPNIYYHDAKVLKQERRDGANISTDIPFKKIELNQYYRPPNEYFRLPRNMLEKEAQELESEWWLNLSLIAFFGRYRDGYVIIYRVPEFDASARCIDYHLGLQILDANFEKRGELMNLKKGLAVGIRHGRAFVVEPNIRKGQGMSPVVYSYKID